MADAQSPRWRRPLAALTLSPEESPAPHGRSGTWFTVLNRFSRHSFLRCLLSPSDSSVHLYLEIGLGPGDPTKLAISLETYLNEPSTPDWIPHLREFPWVFERELPFEEQDDEDRLCQMIAPMLKLVDFFPMAEEEKTWKDFFAAALTPPGASAPFEQIGASRTNETPQPQTEVAEATLIAFGLTHAQNTLLIALGFGEVLTNSQIRTLEEGLQGDLGTRFEGRLERIGEQDRAELRLPLMARTQCFFRFHFAQQSPSEVQSALERYLERLKKFSAYGVDLFEYLGVGQTLFAKSSQPSLTPGKSHVESGLSPLAPRESTEADHQEVILDLGFPTSPSSRHRTPSVETTLTTRDFTDPRLQREDATTPLVDLVLRHPGYFDRRIGQVLSILLSIEYHDAIQLADSAPCVIAWGISQERARSFQEVIESAGGKALLVEPDSFRST